MADLGGVFDANTVDPMGDYTPLPEGEYRAAITKSENKPTKAGNGTFLELTWTVLEGEHAKKTVISRLNLVNPNQQAVEIARSELSAVCRAVGVMAPSDSSQLHDQPALIKVALEKRNDDPNKFSNAIKGYKHVSKATKPSQAAADSGAGKPSFMS